MKSYKETNKSSYKPVLKVNQILQLKKDNPNMVYAAHRIDDQFDPQGVLLEERLEEGWEIVVESGTVTNDYDSTKSRDTEESYKSTPITRKGKGGAEFVYLCRSKEDELKAHQERIKRDQELFVAKTKGRKVERSGNNMRVTDPDVNPNNIQLTNDE